MRKEYETTLIIDGEIQGASIPRAPRGVAAKYRADPGYRVTDVVGDETVAILYIETVKQERTQCKRLNPPAMPRPKAGTPATVPNGATRM